MTQIRKVSVYILYILNVSLIALPTFAILWWSFIDANIMKSFLAQDLIHTPHGVMNLSTVKWNFVSKLLGLSSSLIGWLPLFLSFIFLKKIFQNYRKGEIFSIVNAKHYRRLGLLFFLNALITQPLSKLLLVLAASLYNPPGKRYITLQFGVPNLEAIFCGVLVIVISWVMLEASKLHNEQKLTI